MQAKRVIIINDCSDANARLRIEAQVALAFPDLPATFYKAEPFATLSLSFLLAEAQFGAGDVVLFNAAPRGAEKTQTDNRAGVMVFVVLKNGALLVGPNEGHSLTLIKEQVQAIYLKKGDDGNQSGTQFRSAYVFPKAAGEFVATAPEQVLTKYIPQDLASWPWREIDKDYIVWFDSFDNVKLSAMRELVSEENYIVRFLRDGKLMRELRMPYKTNMTQLALGELGIITGSSFAHRGLEIVVRTGRVGMVRTRQRLLQEYGLDLQIEDEVQIT